MKVEKTEPELRNEIYAALHGARYHREKIRALIAEHPNFPNRMESSSDPEEQVLQDLSNQLHWHMRGFFWELISCIDMLESYTKSYRADKRPSVRSASSWIEEVRNYRNMSHHSFAKVSVLRFNLEGIDSVAVPLLALDGSAFHFDAPSLMWRMLTETKKLISSIFEVEHDPMRSAETK